MTQLNVTQKYVIYFAIKYTIHRASRALNDFSKFNGTYTFLLFEEKERL